MTLNEIFAFAQLAFSWAIVELALVPIAWTGSDQAILDTPISIFPRVIILFALCYTGVAFSLAGIFYWIERLVRFVFRRPKKQPEVVSEGSFLYYVFIVISFFITAIVWDSTSRFLNS